MAQLTTLALLFLATALLALAEDSSNMKQFLIKLDDYTKLIEEQARVIEDHRNTTEALNRTIQEQEAKINKHDADIQALNKTEGEVEHVVIRNKFVSKEIEKNAKPKKSKWPHSFVIKWCSQPEKDTFSLFSKIQSFLHRCCFLCCPDFLWHFGTCLLWNCQVQSRITQQGTWVSWPMMEMGELTNDSDGWADQWWRRLSWPMKTLILLVLKSPCWKLDVKAHVISRKHSGYFGVVSLWGCSETQV